MNSYKLQQSIEHVPDMLCGVFVRQKIKYSPYKFGINTEKNRKEKIILSLKTYNKRYKTIGNTLKSLLLQTVKPDHIIVWLDEDAPENKITEEMRNFEQYGIEYKHRNLDLKPHGKYFYAMREFPNDIIITVDDDIIYPPDLIESLMKTHEKYPQSVCARRVHLMTLDSNGRLQKYSDWKYEYRRILTPSYLLCATGGAGTLYPPHTLPEEAFIIDDIKKYCLTADDLWLKVMELKNHITVIWVKNHLMLPPLVKSAQKDALSIKNVTQCENDLFIQKLEQIYPSVFQLLINCS